MLTLAPRVEEKFFRKVKLLKTLNKIVFQFFKFYFYFASPFTNSINLKSI